jgi:hypothetical protein
VFYSSQDYIKTGMHDLDHHVLTGVKNTNNIPIVIVMVRILVQEFIVLITTTTYSLRMENYVFSKYLSHLNK